MARHRRILAFAAALCVAWAALWPTVASAHAALSGERAPLCHQAGQMVEPGQAPVQEGAPGGAKVHCPLCIMAFYAAFDPPHVAAAANFFSIGVTRDAHCTPHPAGVEVHLPQPRAPPAILPA
jgi:hypothetical protein